MEASVQASVPFSGDQLQAMVSEAISNVFSMMLSAEAEFKEILPSEGGPSGPVSPCLNTDGPVIAASVGFAGKVNGTIYAYFSEKLSAELASMMLGLSPEEIAEEGYDLIKDTLGEIMNMTVGNFKNKLCDAGFDCELTIPSIVRGTNFTIDPIDKGGLVRKYYRFETIGKPFVMDLQIKVEE